MPTTPPPPRMPIRKTRASPGADWWQAVPVGLLLVNSRGRIDDANATAQTHFGLSRERLLERSLPQLAATNGRKAVRDFLARVVAGTPPLAAEAVFARADGSPFRAQLQGGGAVTDADKARQWTIALSVFSVLLPIEQDQQRVRQLAAANQDANREIARRRTVEASLRQSEQSQREMLAESQVLHTQMRHLTRRMLLAQEEERKAVSRELHDEVAQILAGINVHLAVLNQEDGLDRRSWRRRVAQTQRLVGHSVQVVHRFARQLRPAMLDDLGLIPALRSYLHELPGRKALRIRFSAFSEVETLDNLRRTVLYRVAQEALTNVTRHAQASVVTVRIQRAGPAVRLTVHDNGKSFQPERLLASPTFQRLGLLGMRERVEMVGGKLEIASAPGEGTTIRATIPFQANGDSLTS
jgi:PAS domain S-box-containing protein